VKAQLMREDFEKQVQEAFRHTLTKISPSILPLNSKGNKMKMKQNNS
jgi:hypothetical protein